MPPPDYPAQRQLVLPLLDEIVQRGGSAAPAEVIDALAQRFHLGAEARAHTTTLPSGTFRTWDRHARWAFQQAKAKGLIRPARRNLWEATPVGERGLRNARPGVIVSIFRTRAGEAFWATAETFVECIDDGAATLIVTSPPYLLTRAKPYGGPATEPEYVEWIVALAAHWHRILADDGTLVLNLGPSFLRGSPAQSLYRERIYLRLQDDIGLHLAQDGYWENPSKLPAPAEWVTVRRERLTPSVEHCYAFSKTPHPKWRNTRVQRPYSASMLARIAAGGEREARRPSGHRMKDGTFGRDCGGSIPSHLLRIPNTRSTGRYLEHCREHRLPIHPARFPEGLAEFYIDLCTERGDLVVDCFAGSLTVAERAEAKQRGWVACERSLTYLAGGAIRLTPAAGFECMVDDLPGI